MQEANMLEKIITTDKTYNPSLSESSVSSAKERSKQAFSANVRGKTKSEKGKKLPTHTFQIKSHGEKSLSLKVRNKSCQ